MERERINAGARALFFQATRLEERAELLWIASTYLVGMNESGNQKGNLSYLAGTKKRSDSLIQLIFHKCGARAGDDARALFLSNASSSPRCASAIQIVRPLESIAETQPQLHPALLSLSAMISQYFTNSDRASLSPRKWQVFSTSFPHRAFGSADRAAQMKN